MSSPQLIAIDWGTSNLRASLLGAGGAVLESRAAAGGVMAVTEGRFAEALNALCGDWIEAHACPAIWRRNCSSKKRTLAFGLIGRWWVQAP